MTSTIYSRFYDNVKAHPGDTAVKQMRSTISYEQLSSLVDTVQSYFPVTAPRTVGIVLEHSAVMIASMLAVLKAGAAYVPAEPSFPIERIKFMMNEADVDFIITDQPQLMEVVGRNMLIIDKELKTRQVEPYVPSTAKPTDLAYILYTSGTTGQPKGVRVTNANVCHYADAFYAEFGIGSQDVMLQYSVCTFDIFVEEVFASLLNGAAIAIPGKLVHNNLRRTLQFAERAGVTIISGFPYLLQDINNLGYLPRTVRLLISGGDVLRASYITNLTGKAEIYNTYGPSETTVCATYQRCDNIPPLADGTYPIGHAVEGTQVRVLDPEWRPVADGEVGEICIYGDGVSLGYVGNRPEQANFTTDADGRPMYASGDMGYVLPDGRLAFLHRKDTQVMIKGKRVECNEVENVLCGINEIDKAAVRAYTDSEGLSHLVAYVVPTAECKLLASKLRAQMSRFLASFMIPEKFVKLASMPLNANGKVDDARLQAISINNDSHRINYKSR